MKPMKAYTHINRMVGLAPLVLFLSSYLPLFLIIIIRQMITNAEFLEWGGFNIEATFIPYLFLIMICLNL